MLGLESGCRRARGCDKYMTGAGCKMQQKRSSFPARWESRSRLVCVMLITRSSFPKWIWAPTIATAMGSRVILYYIEPKSHGCSLLSLHHGLLNRMCNFVIPLDTLNLNNKIIWNCPYGSKIFLNKVIMNRWIIDGTVPIDLITTHNISFLIMRIENAVMKWTNINKRSAKWYP